METTATNATKPASSSVDRLRESLTIINADRTTHVAMHDLSATAMRGHVSTQEAALRRFVAGNGIEEIRFGDVVPKNQLAVEHAIPRMSKSHQGNTSRCWIFASLNLMRWPMTILRQ